MNKENKILTLPKRGFYTENEKHEVVFVEVKEGKVDDKAESMLDFKEGEIWIDCYYSFNDYEISSNRLEALKELGVTTLIGIESRINSKEELEKYEVTQREMELYKIIKNEDLSYLDELRENLIEVISNNFIEKIKNNLSFNDIEFLSSVITGEGYIPLNNLSLEELIEEFLSLNL